LHSEENNSNKNTLHKLQGETSFALLRKLALVAVTLTCIPEVLGSKINWGMNYSDKGSHGFPQSVLAVA
jgi:hypothetical protein